MKRRREGMRRGTLVVGLISAVATVGLVTTSAAAASVKPTGSAIPTNVDASQWHHNESEGTIAVNPTNPSNIVIVTNVDFPAAGMFKGVSFDGGKSWARTLIGNGDNLGDACCDPTMSFDSSGTLFMAYLLNAGATVPIAYSTDGGATFTRIPDIAKPASANSVTASERKGCSDTRISRQSPPGTARSGWWSTRAVLWSPLERLRCH